MNLPENTNDRLDLWAQIIQQASCKTIAEIGVWKGVFAESTLQSCPTIEQYIMIDPWAQLPDWNKPFNVTTKEFESVYNEAMEKTEFAADKRVILRGRTRDVVNQIEDESLDFVYIDGDHTLRGITLDLISIFPKVKPGGIIAGDDFTLNPWQHASEFEPTLVCPFAVYFAEAMDLPIRALPYGQFLIEKTDAPFQFEDTTGNYADLSLNRFSPRSVSRVQQLKRTIKRIIK